MSKAIKTATACAVLFTLAACGGERDYQEEIIIVEPAPIVMEPVSNKM